MFRSVKGLASVYYLSIYAFIINKCDLFLCSILRVIRYGHRVK